MVADEATLPDEWTEDQRAVYGRMLRFMLANQELFTHPDTPRMPEDQWRTIAHNAACIGADFSGGGEVTIMDGDTVIATTETTKDTH